MAEKPQTVHWGKFQFTEHEIERQIASGGLTRINLEEAMACGGSTPLWIAGNTPIPSSAR